MPGDFENGRLVPSGDTWKYKHAMFHDDSTLEG